MIAYLEGTVTVAGTEAVITVGGGIGLDVQLSALSADKLPPVGQAVRLWTHLAVREDHWSLYGFLDAEERQMFRLLITVSGVGPKVAMGMLGKASAEEIARALRAGDEKALVRLPGIGKKSAQRLVVELGQQIPESVLGGVALGAGGSVESGGGGLVEALAVMQAMGLGPAAAEAALVKARSADPSVSEDLEAWVRAALRGV